MGVARPRGACADGGGSGRVLAGHTLPYRLLSKAIVVADLHASPNTSVFKHWHREIEGFPKDFVLLCVL